MAIKILSSRICYMANKHYEVLVIGGGISGAALFYELAKYTDVKSIALLEKYDGLATLNSKLFTLNTIFDMVGTSDEDVRGRHGLDIKTMVPEAARHVAARCLAYSVDD